MPRAFIPPPSSPATTPTPVEVKNPASRPVPVALQGDLPLPADAATETTLAALAANAATETTLAAFSSKLPAPSGGRVPVTAEVTSSVLPAGAATETTLGAVETLIAALLAASDVPARYDSFGRARMGLPHSTISLAQDYARGSGAQQRALRMTSRTSNGSITVNASRASRTGALTGAAAGYVEEQSREYSNYRAGQSQLLDITFCFGAAVTGVTKRAGLFDPDDGIYFEQGPTGTLSLVIRSSASGLLVENSVPQSNWNMDKLDGTGTGITLDSTRVQIFALDLQFLGVGRVRCGFVIDGEFKPAHEFHHSNEVGQTTVYMRSANLPARWEIRSSGATAAASMEYICASIIREGGPSDPAADVSCERSSLMTLSTAEWRVLLALRISTTYIRAAVRDFAASVYNTDATNGAQFKFFLDPTITDPSGRISWTPVTAAYATSVCEFADPADTATRATVTGGHPFGSDIAPGGRGVVSGPTRDGLPLTGDINGTSSILVLAGRAVSGTPAVTAALRWREA